MENRDLSIGSCFPSIVFVLCAAASTRPSAEGRSVGETSHSREEVIGRAETFREESNSKSGNLFHSTDLSDPATNRQVLVRPENLRTYTGS